MKTFVLASAISLAFVSGSAMAQCAPGTRLSASQITTLVTNNTVCSPASAATYDWQELHATGGTLTDYKRGPGHATDPSENVGTWSVTGTGVGSLTHNYGTGGTYTYTVHGTGVVGTNHNFCVGSTPIVGRVKSGGGAC